MQLPLHVLDSLCSHGIAISTTLTRSVQETRPTAKASQLASTTSMMILIPARCLTLATCLRSTYIVQQGYTQQLQRTWQRGTTGELFCALMLMACI